jgi:hypothetical protein
MSVHSLQESIGNAQNAQLSSKGAEIRPYDVTSTNAISSLKDVDVLISTVGPHGLALQSTLVDAAHAAGVKLLVPAEFGDTTDGRSEPIFRHKVAIREQAKKLGLPTVAVFTGLWTEFILQTGFDLKGGKITINGQGDGQLSTTSIEDVAHFVAHVLTALPKDQLENAKFTLQGDVIVSTFMALVEFVAHLRVDLQLACRVPPETVLEAHRGRARPSLGARGEAQSGPERSIFCSVHWMGSGQGSPSGQAVARPCTRLAAQEGGGCPEASYPVDT